MPSNTRPGLGLAAILLSVLIWGTQFPIAKQAMQVMDGFSLSVLRYALACSVLLLVLALREGPGALRLEGRLGITLLAGLGIASSAVIVFVGLSLTRPEVAVVIIQLQPAMIALAEWRLHGKRPSRFTRVCMFAAFCGVLFAVTDGGVGIPALLRTNPTELVGDFLVWLGTVGWVGYTLTTGRLSGWSSLRLATLTCTAGFVLIAATWVVAALLGGVRWPAVDALMSVSANVLHVALLGVVLAMFAWNVGVRHIGALNSMLLLHLMPVVTFAHRALEGARIGSSEIIGALIVIGALVANNLHVRRHLAQQAVSDAGVLPDERDTPAT